MSLPYDTAKITRSPVVTDCCTGGSHCVLQAAGASCCGAAGEVAVAAGEGATGAVAVAALVRQPPVLS